MTTTEAWLGIGAAFGNPHMEAILSCGVPRKLKNIWDKTSKLNTGGAASFQEISVKGRKRDKEIVSSGGLLPHKDPLYLIEGLSVFTISRHTMRDLDIKELGKVYDQPKQEMEIIKVMPPGQVRLHFWHIFQKYPLRSLAGVWLDSQGSYTWESVTYRLRNRVIGNIYMEL